MEKEGWTVVNGEKRYCLLSANTLSMLSEPFGKVKLDINLSEYALSSANKAASSLLLTPLGTSKQKKTIILTYEESSLAVEWLFACKSWATNAVFPKGSKRNSIQKQRELVSPRGRGVGGHAGWLLLGGKKRFFRIDEDTFILFWASKETKGAGYQRMSGVVEGSLQLRDCTVTRLDGTSFEIVTKTGTKMVLTAQLKTEATTWIDAIELMLQQLGVVVSEAVHHHDSGMRGHLVLLSSGSAFQKKRYVLLKGQTLSWYNNESDTTPEGSLSLLSCGISESGRCFSVTTKNGKTFEWMAKSNALCQKWLGKLRDAISSAHTKRQSGVIKREHSSFDSKAWVKRKNKKLFFVLRNNTILWYEQEQGSDAPEKCCDSVTLSACSRAHGDDSNADGIVIELYDFREEPIRFECVDSAQVKPLVNHINRAIERCQRTLDEGSMAKKEIVHRGAAKRNGKQRFLVLTTRQLRWFQSENAFKQKKSEKGSHLLEDCVVDYKSDDVDKDASLVVTLPTGKQSTLLFSNGGDARLWWKRLRETIADADRTIQPDRVFGVPLHELVARNPNAMPHVLTEPIVFIEKYANDTPGLFRESGNQSDILRYRKQLNSGVAVKFSKDADAHIVAGVWKMWLRELPEPLIPFVHYEEMMQIDADKDDMLAILKVIPRANRIVLEYILDFLYRFSLNEEQHSMSVSNLAIVFGPLFLRCGDEDQIRQLRDSGHVMSIAREMIRQRAVKNGHALQEVYGNEHLDALAAKEAREKKAAKPTLPLHAKVAISVLQTLQNVPVSDANAVQKAFQARAHELKDDSVHHTQLKAIMSFDAQ